MITTKQGHIVSVFNKSQYLFWELWLVITNDDFFQQKSVINFADNDFHSVLNLDTNVIQNKNGELISFKDYVTKIEEKDTLTSFPFLLGTFIPKAEKQDGKTVWEFFVNDNTSST